MPFPGSVATVVVTKDYRDANGEAPKRVTVRFRPSARKVLTSQDITIEPIPVTRLVTNGLLSVVLAATDGFSYEVSETVDGKQRPPFNILVPAAIPTPTYVLDELAPIEPVTPQYTPVRTVEGIGPDPNGNIDLPASAGSAPSSRLIATTSGLQGGGDLSADRTLSPVYGTAAGTVCQGDDSRLSDSRTPLAHTHAQSDVTGLAASLAGKENTGVAAGLVAAHEAASDPHSQYLTATEGNAAYSALGHTHSISNVTGLQTALDGKADDGDIPQPAGVADFPGSIGQFNQVGVGTKWAHSDHSHSGAMLPIMREAYIKSGNVNLNTGSSSWGALPTFPTLSIPASAGHKIGMSFSALRQTNANLVMDIGVLVGGTIKRWLGGNYTDSSLPPGGYEGDPTIYHTALPSTGGERRFTVTNNDLDSGNVVFAVLCKVNGAGSALLLADTINPFYWQATNYGVVG